MLLTCYGEISVLPRCCRLMAGIYIYHCAFRSVSYAKEKQPAYKKAGCDKAVFILKWSESSFESLAIEVYLLCDKRKARHSQRDRAGYFNLGGASAFYAHTPISWRMKAAAESKSSQCLPGTKASVSASVSKSISAISCHSMTKFGDSLSRLPSSLR